MAAALVVLIIVIVLQLVVIALLVRKINSKLVLICMFVSISLIGASLSELHSSE